MRHRKRGQYPASSSKHAQSLLRNQAAAILVHGEIITTTAKAKCLRPYLERLITKGVRANAACSEAARVSGIRNIDSKLRNREALEALINVAARIFADRPGGYTRILKIGYRDGDSAELSIIQLVTDDSSFNAVLPPDYLEKTCLPRDRYAYLKGYCMANRYPSRAIINQWVGYKFPPFELSVNRVGPQVIQTVLQIPGYEKWNLDQWPTVHRKSVPLQLVLHFFISAENFGKDRVTMRPLSTFDGVTMFPPQPDATAISLVINPGQKLHKGSIVIEHEFTQEPPSIFSAALAGPYCTLKSVCWTETAHCAKALSD